MLAWAVARKAVGSDAVDDEVKSHNPNLAKNCSVEDGEHNFKEAQSRVWSLVEFASGNRSRIVVSFRLSVSAIADTICRSRASDNVHKTSSTRCARALMLFASTDPAGLG
jgi:hypothetical protein